MKEIINKKYFNKKDILMWAIIILQWPISKKINNDYVLIVFNLLFSFSMMYLIISLIKDMVISDREKSKITRPKKFFILSLLLGGTILGAICLYISLKSI
ncbi:MULTISPECIES: hypothetical protein [Clostridium]|uniref:Uncharacterized protein n=1 Tax=Clostridium senegalense TaxID=1465809 RepID=A0A6M0H6Z4_9CLOT|nr:MULTISPECIES: hypothetical protein [Clostridium]NEU05611.1 hypothetical protein [Clostridium senegalense]